MVNNELIFFRKFSDPDTRKADEPRLHYYKIKILQVWIILGTYYQAWVRPVFVSSCLLVDLFLSFYYFFISSYLYQLVTLPTYFRIKHHSENTIWQLFGIGHHLKPNKTIIANLIHALIFDCGVTLIFILASCSPVLDKLPHCLFAGRPTSAHRLRTDRIIIYWSKNFVISQSAMEYIGWHWKVPDYDSDSVLKYVRCSHDLWRNWKLALFQFNRCLQMKISSNWKCNKLERFSFHLIAASQREMIW